ncbi:uroporphyrinogen decarboxylase family protein [Clostridium thailandense]|uniref:uroporphyrinogen decarboxylase family protein n=1 Tax=Clostridium thailandense TaxID=2794346 RepID=UPI0039898C75
MKNNQEKYSESLKRINAAVALEKADRTPVVLMGDAFFANQSGVKLSEFCTSTELSHQTQLKGLLSLGEVDGIEMPHMNVNVFPAAWLANIKIPGRDLKEGTLWQMDEKELMKVEDYDIIIEKGWNYFFVDYAINRLSTPENNLLEKLQSIGEFTPKAIKNYKDAGIVTFSPLGTGIPFESFTGGRSMVKFSRDLFKIPDKVQAAMDAAMPELLEGLRQQIRAVKPYGVWFNGMRGASEFMSRKIWERFVWPYAKKLAETIIEEGAICYFHMDANWERDLEFFRSLPKGKCVFGTDHATDIYKIKEILGDHMCIMGDVPAAMLAIGTSDEVYDYSTKIIKDMGNGFILSQGCDIPPNAKLENVKAMVAAASGK